MPAVTFFEALITGRDDDGNKPSMFFSNDKLLDYYWGEPTALIDWCETNYTNSKYIAELHNTWTNLAYITVGILVVKKCYIASLPLQFWACGFSIVLTGLFSGMFHATLWYWMQRLDEIFENAILITMIHSDKKDSVSISCLHFIGCSLGIVFVSQFLFCEIHLVVSILLCLLKFHRVSCNGNQSISTNVRKAAIWTICGFGCWLLDRLGCDLIVQYAWPVNPQFHAWWHIFTSIALWEGFMAISQVDVEKGAKSKDF